MLKSFVVDIEKTVYEPKNIFSHYSMTSLPILFIHILPHALFQFKIFDPTATIFPIYVIYFMPEFLLLCIVFLIDNWDDCDYVIGTAIDCIAQSSSVWSSTETLLLPYYYFYGLNYTFPLMLVKGILSFLGYNWYNNFRWYYAWDQCKKTIHDFKIRDSKEDYVDLYLKKAEDILTKPDYEEIVPFEANIIDERAKWTIVDDDETQNEKNIDVLQDIGADSLL